MVKKNLLRADLEVRHVTEINFSLLAEKGIRGLLLDLDNTLTVWHGMEVDPAVQAWLDSGKARGFRLCILSNSHEERVRPMGELLGLQTYYMSLKPRKSAFCKGCRELGLPPQQVAMVGDQLFTDICGGNLAGLMTILTEPIDPREMWGTRHIARPLESLVRKLQGKK
ncbi:MAG: YqeG family HAD IIIA-type phosphatase [Bacillota bacterium]|nr:YqeG family HAD IIIA-type phosphatase [Bacillota bacterium]